MGILAAQVARSFGVRVTLLGTDKDEVRLHAAHELGFDVTSTPPPAGGTGANPGFDVVVECSGSQGGISTALDAVRKRGRYIQIGVVGKSVSQVRTYSP
jgi:L-iditol 2-dehydrogenase